MTALHTHSYIPSGTVYGTLLNFRHEWALWADRMTQPPYQAAPQAPVLYVKTANTFCANSQAAPLPLGAAALEVGASLGLVMGDDGTPTACVLLNDLQLPHASYYRPPVKFKNGDGWLGIGQRTVPLDELGGLQALATLKLQVSVNGEHCQTVDLSTLRRDAAQLLADVGEFMTLQPGDVLMMGTDALADGTRPRVQAGDRVEISAPGFEPLAQTITAVQPTRAPLVRTKNSTPPQRRARVAWAGAVHDAVESDGQLLLTRSPYAGQRVPFDDVIWLPPLEPVAQPRTVLALGLNYADHARELAFKAPEEPLAFVKGAASLIGHRAYTRRPTGVKFMHYECELAVVIGRTARNVKKDDAYDFIAGYTVANDYAIRDYLENWYRPNLRVKNRDTCTPIGPWLVDAAWLQERHGSPMNLALQTTVNGEVTQRGHTRDMIFDVPTLIEYFSSFMTLNPGDLILTGTPDGVVNCQPGDVVVTEIEGLGALQNTLIAAP